MSTPPTRPPGRDDESEVDRLPCGAAVDRLLDQVAAGAARSFTDHQADCPHCQAALAEYDRLWSPVRELAAEEISAPDTLLEETIQRLRGATSDPTFATLPGPRGSTRIAARVVVVTARETAQDVDGVRVALSNIVRGGTGSDSDAAIDDDRSDDPLAHARVAGAAQDDGPRVVAGIAGRSTAIEITLAADYGVDLVALGERIRERVTDRIRALTGLDPVNISVVIDDVFT